LEHAVTRPSTIFCKNYQRASTEIFNTINSVLSIGLDLDPEASRLAVEKYLNRLQSKLEDILKKKEKDAAEPLGENKAAPTNKDGFCSRVMKFLGLKNDHKTEPKVAAATDAKEKA
jgi:hypothetical protein